MSVPGIRMGLLACAILCVAAGAEVPTGRPVSSPEQGVTQQKPTFVVNVELIQTDVIVRDRRGQFVADLKKEEFRIFEDDVEQEIATFTLSHGGRIFNQVEPPPMPQREGIILPPRRPVSDAAGRIFILFIDDLHLSFRNTGRLRDLIKKISQTLIHEGDMFGVVSTGPSSLSIDLTYDVKRLDEVVRRVSGSGLKPSDIIGGPESADGPSEVRYRAHVAFATAADLMRNLEQVKDRRKALIYLSEGYDFNPFEKSRSGQDPYSLDRDSTSSDDTMDEEQRRQQEQERLQRESGVNNSPLRQSQQFADADLAVELADLTRAANRANVSIYTIDPRGLVGMPEIDENLDMSEWMTYVQKSIDSLRVLAEQTGGVAVVNQNDFERALKRIDNETSDYYVIGYYSKNPDPLRRIRLIRVEVTRSDLTVWSRRYYQLKRPAVRR